MTRGICYYTDNRLDEPLFSYVQAQIKRADLPIVSVSLEPIDFGQNAYIEADRGYLTMVKQIIAALKISTADHVFFCEHDVLYDPSHFEFTPPRDDIFYYNENIWRWWLGTDKAIRHDRMLSLSNLCVNREFALDHYLRRFKRIKEKGWDKITAGEPEWVRIMGYEPGTKKKKRGGFSDDDFATWSSNLPNIDVRHKGTFSPSKMKLRDFKHKPKWWKEININGITNWKLKDLS